MRTVFFGAGGGGGGVGMGEAEVEVRLKKNINFTPEMIAIFFKHFWKYYFLGREGGMRVWGGLDNFFQKQNLLLSLHW